MITDKKTIKKIIRLAVALGRLNTTDAYIMYVLINKIIDKHDLSKIDVNDIKQSINNIIK